MALHTANESRIVVLFTLLLLSVACVAPGKPQELANALQNKYDSIDSYSQTVRITYQDGSVNQWDEVVQMPDKIRTSGPCGGTIICVGNGATATEYQIDEQYGTYADVGYDTNFCAQKLRVNFVALMETIQQTFKVNPYTLVDVNYLREDTFDGRGVYLFEIKATAALRALQGVVGNLPEFKLWADKDTYWPLKLEEYENGKLKQKEERLNFKPNIKPAASLFQPTANLRVGERPAITEQDLVEMKKTDASLLLPNYNLTLFSASRNSAFDGSNCVNEYKIEYWISVYGGNSILIRESQSKFFDPIDRARFGYKETAINGFQAWTSEQYPDIYLKKGNYYYSVGVGQTSAGDAAEFKTHAEAQAALQVAIPEIVKSLR